MESPNILSFYHVNENGDLFNIDSDFTSFVIGVFEGVDVTSLHFRLHYTN